MLQEYIFSEQKDVQLSLTNAKTVEDCKPEPGGDTAGLQVLYCTVEQRLY